MAPMTFPLIFSPLPELLRLAGGLNVTAGLAGRLMGIGGGGVRTDGGGWTGAALGGGGDGWAFAAGGETAPAAVAAAGELGLGDVAGAGV